MKIPDKKIMYQMLHAGEFGNRWWGWQDPGEFYYEAYKFFPNPDVRGWAVRSMVPGGPFAYGLKEEEAWRFARMHGGEISPIDEVLGIPTVARGQFYRGTDGLHLELLGTTGNWRQAPRTYWERSSAFKILQDALSEDFDDVYGLLDRFDGAVVEFGCYGRRVGVDSRRTVIWEVRHY